VVFVVDMSSWIPSTQWPILYNTISQFLLNRRVSSYAFVASSFTSADSYQFSKADVNTIDQDFAQFNQLVNSVPYDNTRRVSAAIDRLRGAEYQSRYVIIFSDYGWQASDFQQVLSSLQNYYRDNQIGSGRAMFVQFGASQVRSELTQLTQIITGSYAVPYSSLNGFTSESMDRDWQTLTAGISVNTPPPDINSPDHENNGRASLLYHSIFSTILYILVVGDLSNSGVIVVMI
jgi:hypothetical protein